MPTDVYLSFLVAATVIIVVPGPTNLAIVADTIAEGPGRSLWTVAGAALSHALFIAVATAGIAAVLDAYPGVFVFLRWFGVLYLGAQGLRLILGRAAGKEDPPAGPGRRPRARSLYLLKGFLVNSTNPKALLFYAALFPPFVGTRMAFLPQLVTLSVTFLGIFLVVGAAHALLAQKARDALGNRKNLAVTNRVSGAVMVGAAVWMATK